MVILPAGEPGSLAIGKANPPRQEEKDTGPQPQDRPGPQQDAQQKSQEGRAQAAGRVERAFQAKGRGYEGEPAIAGKANPRAAGGDEALPQVQRTARERLSHLQGNA